MESITRLQLTCEELVAVNHCRIYLRALFFQILRRETGPWSLKKLG